jgi:hypothetical protein
MSVAIGIDVPNMDDGIRFYTRALGFEVRSTPVPGVAVLKAGDMTVCLLEKKAGTRPSPDATDMRQYDRHWTPVHLDIHVSDFDAALARALEPAPGRNSCSATPSAGRRPSAAIRSATASVCSKAENSSVRLVLAGSPL